MLGTKEKDRVRGRRALHQRSVHESDLQERSEHRSGIVSNQQSKNFLRAECNIQLFLLTSTAAVSQHSTHRNSSWEKISLKTIRSVARNQLRRRRKTLNHNYVIAYKLQRAESVNGNTKHVNTHAFHTYTIASNHRPYQQFFSIIN